MNREVAFLMRRHREICSSTTLTLCHSWRVFVCALLSSLSRTVRRQSSIASLNAVTVRITIIGTAPNPGFEAPKIGNTYYSINIYQRERIGMRGKVPEKLQFR